KYSVAPEKIDVVHESIADAFSCEIAREVLETVRTKYRLPGRFLLYPAATWLHKNHARLLEALAAIRERTGACPPLVLTGMDRESGDAVDGLIRRFGLTELV